MSLAARRHTDSRGGRGGENSRSRRGDTARPHYRRRQGRTWTRQSGHSPDDFKRQHSKQVQQVASPAWGGGMAGRKGKLVLAYPTLEAVQVERSIQGADELSCQWLATLLAGPGLAARGAVRSASRAVPLAAPARVIVSIGGRWAGCDARARAGLPESIAAVGRPPAAIAPPAIARMVQIRRASAITGIASVKAIVEWCRVRRHGENLRLGGQPPKCELVSAEARSDAEFVPVPSLASLRQGRVDGRHEKAPVIPPDLNVDKCWEAAGRRGGRGQQQEGWAEPILRRTRGPGLRRTGWQRAPAQARAWPGGVSVGKLPSPEANTMLRTGGTGALQRGIT